MYSLAHGLSFYRTHTKSHEPALYFCFQLGLEENTTLKITVNDWTFHQRRQMGRRQGQSAGPALLMLAAP